MDLPLPIRMAVLFAAGACSAAGVNALACLYGEKVRRYSPWLAPEKKAPDRRWDDRIPIVGWLGLRREAKVHGHAHWIRPMLVEFGTAIALPALYWWEVVNAGLTPSFCEAPSVGVLHGQYFVHVLFLMLLLAASLIDLDDQIIPDIITVPGTLLGLLIATLAPWTLLPVADPAVFDQVWSDPSLPFFGLPTSFLSLSSPLVWPATFGGESPNATALIAGFACWWAWVLALMPHTWFTRRGWRRAIELRIARLTHRSTWWLWGMGLAGTVACPLVWSVGGHAWQGLMTALVGLAVGGGMIWAVRIIGRYALLKEAMGFGDVIFMAMIGVFLGWQTCLIVFFLAPVAGLVFGGLAYCLARGESALPYGPFLAIGAAAAVVWWAKLWDSTVVAFSFGWLLPVTFGVCLVLMGVMLFVWRVIRDVIFPYEEEE